MALAGVYKDTSRLSESIETYQKGALVCTATVPCGAVPAVYVVCFERDHCTTYVCVCLCMCLYV